MSSTRRLAVIRCTRIVGHSVEPRAGHARRLRPDLRRVESGDRVRRRCTASVDALLQNGRARGQANVQPVHATRNRTALRARGRLSAATLSMAVTTRRECLGGARPSRTAGCRAAKQDASDAGPLLARYPARLEARRGRRPTRWMPRGLCVRARDCEARQRRGRRTSSSSGVDRADRTSSTEVVRTRAAAADTIRQTAPESAAPVAAWPRRSLSLALALRLAWAGSPPARRETASAADD